MILQMWPQLFQGQTLCITSLCHWQKFRRNPALCTAHSQQCSIRDLWDFSDPTKETSNQSAVGIHLIFLFATQAAIKLNQTLFGQPAGLWGHGVKTAGSKSGYPVCCAGSSKGPAKKRSKQLSEITSHQPSSLTTGNKSLQKEHMQESQWGTSRIFPGNNFACPRYKTGGRFFSTVKSVQINPRRP